jgi:hypothetical protein
MPGGLETGLGLGGRVGGSFFPGVWDIFQNFTNDSGFIDSGTERDILLLCKLAKLHDGHC